MKNLQRLIIVLSLLIVISLVAGFRIIAVGQESVSLGIGVLLFGVVAGYIGIFVAGVKMYQLKEQRKADMVKKLVDEVEALKIIRRY